MKNTDMFYVCAPLQNFEWQGDKIELLPGVHIERFSDDFSISDFDLHLSPSDTQRILTATHCLSFHWQREETLSPAEIENLFLLSLWLVKPNRAEIAFRFHVGQGEKSDQKSSYRLLDRFRWVKGTPNSDFESSELGRSSIYMERLTAFAQNRKRLNDALLLTITGCWSHAWQTALICYAAAAEGLLTYSTAPKLTARLAMTYACLMAKDQDGRDMEYEEFVNLYSVRSDIMHGRTHKIKVDDRLPMLIRFQEILRKIWIAVMTVDDLANILEDSDECRRKHFEFMQANFVPTTRQ